MGSVDLAGLNVFDIVLLVIFFISVIIGFGRGFVSEVLSLVILVAAFVVAIIFSNSLAAYFSHSAAMQNAVGQAGTDVSQPASYLTLGISFAVLFIGTLIVGLVLKMLLNLLMGAGLIGFGNRILGAIFGACRGVLLDLALVFIIQLSPLTKEAWWQHSHYVPYFQPYIERLGHVISPALSDLKSSVSSAVDDLSGSSEDKKSETTTITLTPDTSASISDTPAIQ